MFGTRKDYPTEATLCERLATVARAQGFKVYSETCGFDMLLVATEQASGFQPGDRIGVEAKLAANVTLLAQALPREVNKEGAAHYYVALVYSASDEFKDVARRLRISTVEIDRIDYAGKLFSFASCRWYRHEVTKLSWLPDCEVPKLAAGVPAPVRLTKWKMDAIKLCLLCEERGFLLRKDFADAGISMTRWYKLKWIRREDVESPLRLQGSRKLQSYVLVPESKPPHLRYPDVAEALRQEALACSA